MKRLMAAALLVGVVAGCKTVPLTNEDGSVVTKPDGTPVEVATGEVDPVKVEPAVTETTAAVVESVERGDDGVDTAIAAGGALLPFLGPQAQLFGGAALSLISLFRRKR